jgi:cell division protein FtsQ
MDPRLAARRRTVAETRIRKALRRLLVVFVALGIVAAGLAVLRSGIFALDQIDVNGRSQTDPEALLAAAGVVRGMPLIEVNLGEATEALLADPRIVTAEVGRRWPTGIEVVLTERFPVAWVERGGGWEHTAIDGVVIATGDPGPVAPRIRSVPGGERAVEAALVFVDALPDGLAAGMVIDARSEELIATWNSYRIRLGRPTDMAAKAQALEVVLADQPEPGSEITLIAPERPAVLPPTTTLPDDDADDD